jgi:hypothetical protein
MSAAVYVLLVPVAVSRTLSFPTVYLREEGVS